jgi:hypothetical protein
MQQLELIAILGSLCIARLWRALRYATCSFCYYYYDYDYYDYDYYDYDSKSLEHNIM